MADKDWRWVERYVTLAGLLDGSLRYAWTRGITGTDDHRDLDPEA